MKALDLVTGVLLVGGGLNRGLVAIAEFELVAAVVGIAALISFALSVSLWFTGDEEQAIFVGIWVPSILALGSLALPRAAGR